MKNDAIFAYLGKISNNKLKIVIWQDQFFQLWLHNQTTPLQNTALL
jgi:hypothetical protein